MADDKPVKIGVVGLGYWGKNYLRLTNENSLTELVGMCDLYPPTLERAKNWYPDIPPFSSVDELLAVPGLEAVVVVVPAKFHHKVGMQILQAGKHVLMEKPLAVSEEECKDMIEAAAGHGVRLLVGHTFLFNSSVAKLKQIMTTDEVGACQYMYAKRTNLGPVRHDVSALWDLATHDISMFLYLLDKQVSWVSCTGSSLLEGSDLADVVFVTIGFKDSPIVAHVHASWMDPNKEREVVVVGERGRVVFEDTEINHPVKVLFKGPEELQEAGAAAQGSGTIMDYVFSARQGDIFKPAITKVEPLGAQMAEFCAAIRDPSYFMRSDGEFGLTVVRILNAAETSLTQGGARVVLTE